MSHGHCKGWAAAHVGVMMQAKITCPHCSHDVTINVITLPGGGGGGIVETLKAAHRVSKMGDALFAMADEIFAATDRMFAKVRWPR